MVGAGTAVGAGAIYSMYQHQKREEAGQYSVYKAQEVDSTAVHRVYPPVLTNRPEVFMGDSIVLDDFSIRDKVPRVDQNVNMFYRCKQNFKEAPPIMKPLINSKELVTTPLVQSKLPLKTPRNLSKDLKDPH